MRRQILVIEDDQLLNRLMVHQLQRVGYAVEGVNSWADAKAYLARHDPDLLILDPKLPDADGYGLLPDLTLDHTVIVLTAYGSVKRAVQAIKSGAAEYLVKPLSLDQLELDVERVLENQALRRDHQYFKSQMQTLRGGLLVGNSPAMQNLRELIDAVAPTDMAVLIVGETGVGKELVANQVHERSRRAHRNFMPVDASTLHENLFESELFGHERGAFTGADRQKKGLIEVAEGGTLFLDEIADINPATQATLLRVIETGHYRRLGGAQDLPADVRVVAATSSDLNQLLHKDDFRADLYYRLAGFVIEVPPLRARRQDIPELVEHLLANHDASARRAKRVTPAAMEWLIAYDWPGNVRELKNVIERAVILTGRSPDLGIEHLPRLPGEAGNAHATTLSFDHEPTIQEVEHSYLRLLLSKYQGHRKRVAETLGISERTAYRLLRRYNL